MLHSVAPPIGRSPSQPPPSAPRAALALANLADDLLDAAKGAPTFGAWAP